MSRAWYLRPHNIAKFQKPSEIMKIARDGTEFIDLAGI